MGLLAGAKGLCESPVDVYKMFPAVGNLISGYKLVTRKKLISGDPVTVADDALNLVGLFSPGSNFLAGSLKLLRAKPQEKLLKLARDAANADFANCVQTNAGTVAPWVIPDSDYLRERVAKEVAKGNLDECVETQRSLRTAKRFLGSVLAPGVNANPTSSSTMSIDVCL